MSRHYVTDGLVEHVINLGPRVVIKVRGSWVLVTNDQLPDRRRLDRDEHRRECRTHSEDRTRRGRPDYVARVFVQTITRQKSA